MNTEICEICGKNESYKVLIRYPSELKTEYQCEMVRRVCFEDLSIRPETLFSRHEISLISIFCDAFYPYLPQVSFKISIIINHVEHYLKTLSLNQLVGLIDGVQLELFTKECTDEKTKLPH